MFRFPFLSRRLSSFKKTSSRRLNRFRKLTVEALEIRQMLDGAGNSMASARDLGTLVGSQSVSDYVGSADTNDYYRFSMGGRGDVQLRLTGLSAASEAAARCSAIMCDGISFTTARIPSGTITTSSR